VELRENGDGEALEAEDPRLRVELRPHVTTAGRPCGQPAVPRHVDAERDGDVAFLRGADQRSRTHADLIVRERGEDDELGVESNGVVGDRAL